MPVWAARRGTWRAATKQGTAAWEIASPRLPLHALQPSRQAQQVWKRSLPQLGGKARDATAAGPSPPLLDRLRAVPHLIGSPTPQCCFSQWPTGWKRASKGTDNRPARVTSAGRNIKRRSAVQPTRWTTALHQCEAHRTTAAYGKQAHLSMMHTQPAGFNTGTSALLGSGCCPCGGGGSAGSHGQSRPPARESDFWLAVIISHKTARIRH